MCGSATRRRIAMRTTSTCETTSRGGDPGALPGITAARISCTAIASAAATVKRRNGAVPKITPSQSRWIGSALRTSVLLFRIVVIRLDIPLPELRIRGIVTVLVVEPIAIRVLPTRGFLLFEPLCSDLVVVIHDQRNRRRGGGRKEDDSVRAASAVCKRRSDGACGKCHRECGGENLRCSHVLLSAGHSIARLKPGTRGDRSPDSSNPGLSDCRDPFP